MRPGLIRSILLTLIIAFSGCAHQRFSSPENARLGSVANQISNYWAGLAKGDVKAIENLLLENHPGPVDRLNPKFADILKASTERAEKEAETVTSYDGHLYTLRRFTSSFNDDHIHLDPMVERVRVSWPSFFVERRNGRWHRDAKS